MVESRQIKFQLDRREYGVSEDAAGIAHVQFDPSDYGIISQYEESKTIYQAELSPTIITLTTHKESGDQIIKKQIMKRKLQDELGINFAYKECVVQSQLKHDNVVKLHEYTESEDQFVLFMEYCNDAAYFDDKIVERLTPITNQDKLQAYALDTLEGLQYIHSQGIIHADLKLQNLLVDRPSPEEKAQGELPRVKVCDFGLAHLREPEKDGKSTMVTRCGTQGYIAPEVGSRNSLVGPEIDMFAVGVIMYELMCAYKPTKLQNFRYGSGPVPFRDRDWKKQSPQAMDFIRQCLEVDPAERLSVEDALQHPWFATE